MGDTPKRASICETLIAPLVRSASAISRRRVSARIVRPSSVLVCAI